MLQVPDRVDQEAVFSGLEKVDKPIFDVKVYLGIPNHFLPKELIDRHSFLQFRLLIIKFHRKSSHLQLIRNERTNCMLSLPHNQAVTCFLEGEIHDCFC